MNTALICMGRLKERYWRDAAAEYEKRLSRFGRYETIELPDLPEPANSSPAIEAQICKKEGEAILAKIRQDDIVIALCIEGKQLDSVQLSRKLTEYGDTGRRVVFVIGGSLGLSPEVVARAQLRLSFSPMTFPHQLARIMLLEQTYRAMKIAAGERYHK
ncbi:MAG: 23S rRNA (pseudouridine(1915)-N(3))-methyltransferase RlmH [Clostridia bacterium]|nr:23S rRNA (pseudouridine(1915)-N(3))-methyltransferase RlmH [Clostridia bacterium]